MHSLWKALAVVCSRCAHCLIGSSSLPAVRTQDSCRFIAPHFGNFSFRCPHVRLFYFWQICTIPYTFLCHYRLCALIKPRHLQFCIIIRFYFRLFFSQSPLCCFCCFNLIIFTLQQKLAGWANRHLDWQHNWSASRACRPQLSSFTAAFWISYERWFTCLVSMQLPAAHVRSGCVRKWNHECFMRRLQQNNRNATPWTVQ